MDKNFNYPQNDGWLFIYKFYFNFICKSSFLRKIIKSYFKISSLEKYKDGLLYKFLAVNLFGKIIPTGGILIRRLTHSSMKPYTLAGCSLKSAKEFWYRACIFEALHFPFFITVVFLSIDRYLSGHLNYAIENMIINLFLNIYPMLHHRHTRFRIERLINLKKPFIKRENV